VRVRQLGKLERRRAVEGWLFVSPFVVGFVLFFAGPMLFAVYISLTDWPILATPKFVGLRNFVELVDDDLFWKSLNITVYYTLFSVPLNLLAGLGIAMLLNQRIRALALFRTLFYVPAVVTGVAVAVLWWMMFNTEYGLLNTALQLVGLPGAPWLTHTRWVIPSFILMSVWHVGGSMVSSTWPGCRAYRPSCTRRPTSTAPAAGRTSAASRCRCSRRCCCSTSCSGSSARSSRSPTR
jgi:multiple sugar transport system permease protein